MKLKWCSITILRSAKQFVTVLESPQHNPREKQLTPFFPKTNRLSLEENYLSRNKLKFVVVFSPYCASAVFLSAISFHGDWQYYLCQSSFFCQQQE